MDSEKNILKNEIHHLKVKRHELLEVIMPNEDIQNRIEKINREIKTLEIQLDNLKN